MNKQLGSFPNPWILDCPSTCERDLASIPSFAAPAGDFAGSCSDWTMLAARGLRATFRSRRVACRQKPGSESNRPSISLSLRSDAEKFFGDGVRNPPAWRPMRDELAGEDPGEVAIALVSGRIP